MSDKVIPATLVTALVLITKREADKTGSLPAPHVFISAGIAWSMLALLSTFAAPLANVISVGLLVTIALQPGVFAPKSATAKYPNGLPSNPMYTDKIPGAVLPDGRSVPAA